MPDPPSPKGQAPALPRQSGPALAPRPVHQSTPPNPARFHPRKCHGSHSGASPAPPPNRVSFRPRNACSSPTLPSQTCASPLPHKSLPRNLGPLPHPERAAARVAESDPRFHIRRAHQAANQARSQTACVGGAVPRGATAACPPPNRPASAPRAHPAACVAEPDLRSHPGPAPPVRAADPVPLPHRGARSSPALPSRTCAPTRVPHPGPRRRPRYPPHREPATDATPHRPDGQPPQPRPTHHRTT
jgi:hypothetical protein